MSGDALGAAVRESGQGVRADRGITVRVRPGIGTLRSRTFVRVLSASLHQVRDRTQLIHFSVQRDHLHLILEASSKRALASAMKSISARIARAVQRVFRRTGHVLIGRYHVRALRTPREVRNALAYVLLNVRRHWMQRTGAAPPARIDEASSGVWFDGWTRSHPLSSRQPPPVSEPRTWLLRVGWRRHGLIDPAEIPGARR
jgi:hypothetical protein